MPELPEVQTVVSQLAAKVVGLVVVGFRSEWAKAVRPSVEVFRKSVVGAKIIGVRRFGKHIVIDLESAFHPSFTKEGQGVVELSNQNTIPPHPPAGGLPSQRGGGIQNSIVIHLKMTGHLLVKTPVNERDEHFANDPYNGYIRHVIELSDGPARNASRSDAGGMRIEFSDLRKFGRLEVVPTVEVERLKSIRELGVDALSEVFTVNRFREILEKKPKAKIGTVLLEQNLIAGIGNIYRSEALFRAGVVPMRLVGSLGDRETKLLHRSIIEVLHEAVELRGMSDGDFRDTDGKMGAFQENAFVYAREGLPCKKCGTIIIRAKLGQRSVFYCPGCQV
jgi:formamidopyrimidine-DNA glycosylase